MVRPWNSNVLPHQWVTVVYGALGPTGVGGHWSRKTGGPSCFTVLREGFSPGGLPFRPMRTPAAPKMRLVER